MCGGDYDNTYGEVTYKIGFFTEKESPIYDELFALVNQFNEELERVSRAMNTVEWFMNGRR